MSYGGLLVKIMDAVNNKTVADKILDILNVEDEVFKLSEIGDKINNKESVRKSLKILRDSGKIAVYQINTRKYLYGTHENIKKLEKLIK